MQIQVIIFQINLQNARLPLLQAVVTLLQVIVTASRHFFWRYFQVLIKLPALLGFPERFAKVIDIS